MENARAPGPRQHEARTSLASLLLLGGNPFGYCRCCFLFVLRTPALAPLQGSALYPATFACLTEDDLATRPLHSVTEIRGLSSGCRSNKLLHQMYCPASLCCWFLLFADVVFIVVIAFGFRIPFARLWHRCRSPAASPTLLRFSDSMNSPLVINVCGFGDVSVPAPALPTSESNGPSVSDCPLPCL